MLQCKVLNTVPLAEDSETDGDVRYAMKERSDDMSIVTKTKKDLKNCGKDEVKGSTST